MENIEKIETLSPESGYNKKSFIKKKYPPKNKKKFSHYSKVKKPHHPDKKTTNSL